MRLSRRSFLKLTGGAIAGAAAAQILTPPSVAAPLFVPAQNLDMGVPRKILTATAMPTLSVEQVAQQIRQGTSELAARMGRTVPMLLLHDEYLTEYGGRLRAGSTLLVEPETAERWIAHGVAVWPDASAAEAARVLPGRDNRYAPRGLQNVPIPSPEFGRMNRANEDAWAQRNSRTPSIPVFSDGPASWVPPEDRPVSTVPHEPWPEAPEISKAERSRMWRQAFLGKA